eukprot:TRINITY_DN2384_c0_g1_i1.p1 TRINITY_DN2384_c0_g1~~TRINITY_DN2384_c0_g1_i1.p1  ORF type:complete len:986 (+),score=115.66 TRINITY_DN2384_c0_g1_i1:102-3059(+)
MIKRSKTDHKEYRYIELPNALRCLLIHDDKVEYSAASLDVNVGSLSDPKEYPGLAHFCEHMLFMGTNKYPKENEYSEFIKNHGGSENAYTGSMHTNFYFSVANDAFVEALGRFSEFFKEPLFCPDAIEREIQAVDSEYKKDLPNDTRKCYQVLLSQANPENPINRFTCGSMETLKKPEIRNVLMEFYEKNYSSNLMSLVLLGKFSLDELEKYAKDNFSGIQNKDLPVLDTTTPPAFGKGRLGKLYKIVPTTSKHILKLKWLFPDLSKKYKSKPSVYLAELLTHEGPNSLLSYLISSQLVSELWSTVEKMNAGIEFLTLSAVLTEKGLQNYEKVIEAAGGYIKMLQAKGPQKYFFEEFASMQQLTFDYMNQGYPLGTASSISLNMHYYDVEDVLVGPYLTTEYDPDTISRLLRLMVPENMLVVLISDSVRPSVRMEEKWYKTKYSVEDIPARIFEAFENPKVRGKLLDYPPPNIFVPKNVEILPKYEGMPVHPRLVKETKISQIWYKQDHKFSVPKAYGYCRIWTNDNDFPVSPESYIYARLYLKAFYEDIREMMYMAYMAGMSCSLYAYYDKMVFRFSGFNDSLPQLVDAFLSKLQKFAPEQHKEHFETILASEIKSSTSYLKTTPHVIGSDMYPTGLASFGADQETELKLLQNITFDNFIRYSKGWLQKAKLNWFIAGNIAEETAIQIATTAEKMLCATPLLDKEKIRPRIVEIPAHTEYIVSESLSNKNETNSCLLSYFQYKPYIDSELRLYAMNHVVFNILREPAFDYLRTKSQLGYVVKTVAESYCRVLGGYFLVQSAKMSPERLYQKVNEFLETMKEKINGMTDEEFNMHIQAASVPFKQNCLNLSEECSQFWGELVNGETLFDENEKIVEVLKEIKKPEIIKYFEELFFENVKRYDYELVSETHLKENEAAKYANKREALKRGNSRIELKNYEEMRAKNVFYPDMFIENAVKSGKLQEGQFTNTYLLLLLQNNSSFIMH